MGDHLVKPGELVRIAPRCSSHDPVEIEDYTLFRSAGDWDTVDCGKFTQKDVGIILATWDVWVDVLVNGVVGYIHKSYIRRVK